MNKDEESNSWFYRFKQFLQGEPQNQEELLELLRDAQLRALISPDTLGIIEGAMQLSQLKVRDIMLPKNQMAVIKADEDIKSILDTVTQTGHSRFPVIEEDGTEVLGILHAKDLLRFLPDKLEDFDLIDICRPASVVPEGKRLDSLLSDFRSSRNHMAIVVDEYGAISGFITIEDIIEQIIGDIEDEFDIDEEAWIKGHHDNHYMVKAHMPIDEFNEAMHTEFSDENYDTIGGLVMNTLGHLPKRGEKITLGNYEFKIVNADARRIKLLECILLPPKVTEQEDS